MAANFFYQTVTKINESRSREIVWRRLGQFHDIDRSTDRLMRQRPEIPPKQRSNIRKQIQQLSFSLTQAKEFFISADSSGPTTRALQAYYGLTALANVTILWEGTGDDSFERRDGRYNSHGLELKLGNSVLDFAADHKHSPGGSLSGLFGLWHKYATHVPHYAESVRHHAGETSTSTLQPISSVTRLSEVAFPVARITLIDCLRHIPSLQQSLISYGFEQALARGRISTFDNFDVDGNRIKGNRKYTIQPCRDEVRAGVMEKFTFPAQSYEDISIVYPPNGLILTIDTLRNLELSLSAPEAFSWSKDDVYFVGSGDYLNEFGYFYIGLYIAGMITRYHPTHWIRELQTNSIATALVDELVDAALTRVPTLVLSALERSIFLYD